MSNYTKATNFAAKDSLPSGNAGKIIKGTEIDTEYNAIASAISSKADTDSPTLTGTPLAPTASAGTNTTQLSTTAFVGTAITNERSATVTLTNKTISAGSNTISGVAASSFVVSNSSGNIDGSASQKAVPSGAVVGTTDSQTLTNKTIAIGSNSVSGTKSQFNTAVTDTDFAFVNDFTGTNQSLGTNGYQKLPGGLIIQWGTVNPSTNTGTVTLPTAFPTACLAVLVTGKENAVTNANLTAYSYTTTTFDYYNSGGTLSEDFVFFAIGY